MLVNKLLAEGIGTFILVLTVLLSSTSSNFPVPVPVMAGLVVGIFVYAIGALSGCHLNPAVTTALMSVKKIKPIEAGEYMIAQFVGALIALGAMYALGMEVVGLTGLNNIYVLVGEIVGTAILVFGISAVVFGKVSDGATGAVIGGALILGAFLASLMGAPGFINPAVALGAQSLNLITLIAPIVGGLLGVWLYKLLINKK